MGECSWNREVERWDVWEIACKGRADGNPFVD